MINFIYSEIETMKKTTSLILLLSAAFAVAGPVPGEWIGRYHALMKDMTTLNKKAFESYFAPGFVWVDPTGKTGGRAEAMKEFDGMFGVDRIVGTVELSRVDKRGDKVDVHFDMHATEYYGKKSTTIHEVGVDTWKKIHGKWMTIKTVDSVMTETHGK